jgi:hypothetical protein
MRRNRNERRQRARYEIALSVRYIVSSQSLVRGTGELENISSAGLLFHCEGRVPVGSRILMEIEWPSQSADAGGAVALIVSGHVVRARASRVAVEIGAHYFRRPGSEAAVWDAADARQPAAPAVPAGSPVVAAVLLIGRNYRVSEASTPRSPLSILRVSPADALGILEAGQPPVSLVITDNAEDFAAFKETVHIVDVDPEAALTQAAAHD